MKGEQPPVSAAIDAWWDAILAGRVDEHHPVHGDDLKVGIKHNVLRLAGALPSEEDRRELLDKAESYVGHGIDQVDAKHLKVVERKEKPGILEQTLIAAFRNRDVAEVARKYLVEIRRVKAKQIEILDSGQEDQVRRLVPEAFLDNVRRSFEAGEAVLYLRVDETDAFKVRELLAEDTRSIRTVATPPTLAAEGGG
ncbi:MAG: hypothetical protein QOI23_1544 [Chloroflexota bacterium]|nr:hypothetical protein [Chloroflexota bacterium]